MPYPICVLYLGQSPAFVAIHMVTKTTSWFLSELSLPPTRVEHRSLAQGTARIFSNLMSAYV